MFKFFPRENSFEINEHYRKEINERIEFHHDVIDLIFLRHTIEDTEKRNDVDDENANKVVFLSTCDAGGS